MPTRFHLAPPPKLVDGLLAVPVDIQSIAAKLTFDGAAQQGVADATITYVVGPTAGNPTFDLRQTISEAWLDGVPIPIARVEHHPFGAGAFTDLRVVESVQAPGSTHTLRVTYELALPASELGGGYLPALEWSPGPRLRFRFGLSDLNRARYLEAWLPANLIWDTYSVALELEIVSAVAHAVITNGEVTVVGANHWLIACPERFSALSPLLELHPADGLAQQIGSVLLPGWLGPLSIEAWKPAASATNLGAQIASLQALLADNASDYGPYVHGDRFVAFFNGRGGMEYEGATTTSVGALPHETFHSWFARGIKPASGADGWWDEAFTSFRDQGADDAVPFDFSDAPVLLCSRDPWQRHTPGNAYTDGAAFWMGLAAMLGATAVNDLMASLYAAHRGEPVSTAMIEEHILSRSGNPMVVDAFHRFVYGLADATPAPDVWMRDEQGDPGSDQWNGVFWDSPDLWVRNADDGGTAHEPPEYGQDNWLHARVRNRSNAGPARHLMVTFHVRGFLGTEFVYPADWLPSMAAAAAFDLEPGASRVVKARWPRNRVPSDGTHTCILASVIARGDHPVAGRHTWEDNNLAQKNVVTIDLQPDSAETVPALVGSPSSSRAGKIVLELRRGKRTADLRVSLVEAPRDLAEGVRAALERGAARPDAVRKPIRLDCGGLLDGGRGPVSARILDGARSTAFTAGRTARVSLAGRAGRTLVGLRIAAPSGIERGFFDTLHLVQRDAETDAVVGGIAVYVRVRTPGENEPPEPG